MSNDLKAQEIAKRVLHTEELLTLEEKIALAKDTITSNKPRLWQLSLVVSRSTDSVRDAESFSALGILVDFIDSLKRDIQQWEEQKVLQATKSGNPD